MGAWLTSMWWGGDPDSPHPVSGLTRREIYAVQKSWEPVTQDSIASGTELLRRLYAASPETKQFFWMVRDTPESEYTKNPQFKAHVLNLMTAITQAVDNLNQPEIVAALMQKLGTSHGKRGIKERHFEDLKNVIVKMFIELLHMDATTLGAWGKTVEFWYKNLIPALQGENGEGR